MVSVPHMNSKVPLKKKESPTVTMITVKTGSPISLSKNILSVRIPKTRPMIREKSSERRNGTPME